jgi:ribosomal protein S18 acetylase RimI-like enzyme
VPAVLFAYALFTAARFALDQGAAWLALAVTEANAAARALYEAAGMETVARYGYRQAAE